MRLRLLSDPGGAAWSAAACVADLLPAAEDVATIASLLGDRDALVAIADSAIRLQGWARARAIIDGRDLIDIAMAALAVSEWLSGMISRSATDR